MSLKGTVAIVTGSSRGIGRAIAIRFAHEGADIAINYSRDEDEAQKMLAQVEAESRWELVVRADLARTDDIQRLIALALEYFGRLDVLVNNAGIESKLDFLEVSEDDYDAILGVNLKGVFFASQAFAQVVVKAGRTGRNINISSVHEEIPFPGCAPCCASKGGLRMLTCDLAVELDPRGITVNAIAPGAIQNEMNQKLESDPAELDALRAQIPLGRLGRPEDVAAVAASLASDDAAYVTGATYFGDGGLTWFYKE